MDKLNSLLKRKIINLEKRISEQKGNYEKAQGILMNSVLHFVEYKRYEELKDFCKNYSIERFK